MIVLDMNLSPAWVSRLGEEGIEAVHWRDVGRSNASDREIMEYARRQGATVFTHDLDFSAILFHTGAKSPSVIQLRGEDVRPATMGGIVAEAVEKFREQLESGVLLTIDARRCRVTVLPLRQF